MNGFHLAVTESAYAEFTLAVAAGHTGREAVVELFLKRAVRNP